MAQSAWAGTERIPPYLMFGHDPVSLFVTSRTADIQRDYPVQRRLNACDGEVILNVPLDQITHLSRRTNTGEEIFIDRPDWQLPQDDARVKRVGPERALKTLAEASTAAQDGDILILDAGIYENDVSIWPQNRLTLMTDGGDVTIRGSKVIEYKTGDPTHNGKGLMIIQGDEVRLLNMRFEGARVYDKNGAALRHEGGRLWVCGCEFNNNQNGILSTGTRLIVDYSRFENNGQGDKGNTHQLYASNGTELIVYGSEFRDITEGHHVKSRAASTTIAYNWIDDEPTGASGHLIDAASGGVLALIGNFLRQGALTQNSTMISFGREGLKHDNNAITLLQNTFVNLHASGELLAFQGEPKILTMNNLFAGNLTLVEALGADVAGNVVVSTTADVDTRGVGKGLMPRRPEHRADFQIEAARQLQPRPRTKPHNAGFRTTGF